MLTCSPCSYITSHLFDPRRCTHSLNKCTTTANRLQVYCERIASFVTSSGCSSTLILIIKCEAPMLQLQLRVSLSLETVACSSLVLICAVIKSSLYNSGVSMCSSSSHMTLKAWLCWNRRTVLPCKGASAVSASTPMSTKCG
jgi:hypothetical protein